MTIPAPLIRQPVLAITILAALTATLHAAEPVCSGPAPSPRVSRTDQKAVFMRSGLSWSRRGDYVVIHVTPPALGGDSDLGNLVALPIADAVKKAKIDAGLIGCVCSGAIPLGQAELIARRWQDADPEKPCLPLPRIGR